MCSEPWRTCLVIVVLPTSLGPSTKTFIFVPLVAREVLLLESLESPEEEEDWLVLLPEASRVSRGGLSTSCCGTTVLAPQPMPGPVLADELKAKAAYSREVPE